jgi:hypothetical protein
VEKGPTVNALAAEWIKFRSLRSNWIVLAIMTAGAIALPVAVVLIRLPHAQDDIAAAAALGLNVLWSYVSYGYSIILWFIAILTILITTSEVSSGTIQSSLLVRPRRGQYYLAKMGFSVLLAVVIYALLSALGLISAYLAQGGKMTSESIGTVFLQNAGLVYGSALGGLIGAVIIATAVAFIFQNSLGSVITFFFVFALLTSLTRLVYSNWGIAAAMSSGEIPWYVWVVSFLPGTCLDALAQGQLNGTSSFLTNLTANLSIDFSQSAYFYRALAALAVYAAVGSLIGYRLLKRRDI